MDDSCENEKKSSMQMDDSSESEKKSVQVSYYDHTKAGRQKSIEARKKKAIVKAWRVANIHKVRLKYRVRKPGDSDDEKKDPSSESESSSENDSINEAFVFPTESIPPIITNDSSLAGAGDDYEKLIQAKRDRKLALLKALKVEEVKQGFYSAVCKRRQKRKLKKNRGDVPPSPPMLRSSKKLHLSKEDEDQSKKDELNGTREESSQDNDEQDETILQRRNFDNPSIPSPKKKQPTDRKEEANASLKKALFQMARFRKCYTQLLPYSPRVKERNAVVESPQDNEQPDQTVHQSRNLEDQQTPAPMEDELNGNEEESPQDNEERDETILQRRNFDDQPTLLPKKKQPTDDKKEAYAILKKANIKDEFSTYGEYVANELRNLSKRSATIAKHLINNTIFEANIGKFEKESCTVTTTTTTLP